MVQAPGTRDSGRESRDKGLYAAGRTAGFLTLAIPAMVLVALVVLLPAYASLAETQYLIGCGKAQVADDESLVTATNQLIADLPVDAVLAKRQAEDLLGCVPENEVVIKSSRNEALPPDVVRPPKHPRPSPPPAWLAGAARRLSNPPTKRGLLLLALGTLITAFFLFARPQECLHKRSAA